MHDLIGRHLLRVHEVCAVIFIRVHRIGLWKEIWIGIVHGLVMMVVVVVHGGSCRAMCREGRGGIKDGGKEKKKKDGQGGEENRKTMPKSPRWRILNYVQDRPVLAALSARFDFPTHTGARDCLRPDVAAAMAAYCPLDPANCPGCLQTIRLQRERTNNCVFVALCAQDTTQSSHRPYRAPSQARR